MKELLFPRGYKPETDIQSERNTPAWENPDSDLFVDWYLRQKSLSPNEQAPEFTTFLDLVATGIAAIPTAEQIARYKISKVRFKAPEQE